MPTVDDGPRGVALKSTGGQAVTPKASSTLLLIIEKQQASWGRMGNASPAVDLVHRAPRATLTVRGRALRMAPVRQPFWVSSPNRLEFRGETKCVATSPRRLTRLRRVSSASNVGLYHTGIH